MSDYAEAVEVASLREDLRLTQITIRYLSLSSQAKDAEIADLRAQLDAVSAKAEATDQRLVTIETNVTKEADAPALG